MLVSFNWLKEYLGETSLTPSEVADLLVKHAFEIENIETAGDDTVLDVDVLPNRSSDCLSHRGIAKEIASITGTPLAYDPLRQENQLSKTDAISVEIDDTDRCSRFTALLLDSVTIADSPQWLQARLKAIGQRPINNIVDATNYVMYAIGQPMHAYDATAFPKQENKWSFGVRTARAGEEISLLGEGSSDDERALSLQGDETLITDLSTDTPVGLAGVKGGTFAGVHTKTNKVIIEAAHFDPTLTRLTARRHNIVIDASKRFENEPSPVLPLYAQNLIAELLEEIAGAKILGMIDVGEITKVPPTVKVSSARVNSLLGVTVPEAVVREILENIGATVEEQSGDWYCTGPEERTDLNIEEDYIEEIGRLYGYDKIQSSLPETVSLQEYNKNFYYSNFIRKSLADLGFSEVITSSFRKKDKVRLKNALASDKSYLRSQLEKNLAEALDKNIHNKDLLGVPAIGIFEIGTVFNKQEDGLVEHTALALGVRVKPSGYSGKEDAILKEATDKVEKVLGVKIDWQIKKGIAECNFDNVVEQLALPTAYQSVEPPNQVSYQAFSVYPAIVRDISMWVDSGVTKESVQKLLQETAGPLCVKITHIDEYQKDERISLAFRLVFQANDKTLTDEEVNTVMDRVYQAVEEAGWETR